MALHSTWTSMSSQTAGQSRDVDLVFGGNMSDGHQHRLLLLYAYGPRHDPQWQNGLRLHHGLRYHSRLQTSSYSFIRTPRFDFSSWPLAYLVSGS